MIAAGAAQVIVGVFLLFVAACTLAGEPFIETPQPLTISPAAKRVSRAHQRGRVVRVLVRALPWSCTGPQRKLEIFLIIVTFRGEG